MKRIRIIFILLLVAVIFIFKTNVYAASCSLSVSSTSVYVGDTFTVTAKVNAAAAWNVHVTASGPVSGCVINQADASSDALDTNKTFNVTCTATNTGTIVVNLTGDVTSAADGNAVGISGTKNVTVTTKPNTNNNNNNNNNNSNNTNNNTNNNNNQQDDGKSKNNNLKELSIEGYDIVKVDNNNYTLTVPNDVTNVVVKATAEDSKAKVTGTGNQMINVGENNIEEVVIAENGSQNKINIKVTRKDGYYLEDLDSALNKNTSDDINIVINYDAVLSETDMSKIKTSNKTVKLNFYNGSKLMYVWTIDGSKIDSNNSFITTLSYETDNKKEILKLSNYADGMYLSLKDNNNAPKGSKIKIYVGHKYTDGDIVNVYSYTSGKEELDLVKEKIKVENGYIEFTTNGSNDYFFTMSNVPKTSNEISTNDNTFSIKDLVLLGTLGLLIIVIIIAILVLLKKKKNKDNKEEIIDFTPDISVSNDSTDFIDLNQSNM